MTLFEFALDTHVVVGTIVLVAFWTAALSAKGSAMHRRGGRIYVWAMAALLSVTLVMTAGMVLNGDARRAMFNVYVTLISVASVWIAWSSIAYRGDIDRYLGWPYKLFCVALGAYGLFVLSLAPRMPEPARQALVLAFAVLGLSIAAAMAWRLWKRDNSPRWWLAEHLTGMGINFAATHASFSILAGGSIFPMLKEPWVRTGMLVAWMTSALLARLWAGRRFLRGERIRIRHNDPLFAGTPAHGNPSAASQAGIGKSVPGPASVQHTPGMRARQVARSAKQNA